MFSDSTSSISHVASSCLRLDYVAPRHNNIDTYRWSFRFKRFIGAFKPKPSSIWQYVTCFTSSSIFLPSVTFSFIIRYGQSSRGTKVFSSNYWSMLKPRIKLYWKTIRMSFQNHNFISRTLLYYFSQTIKPTIWCNE